MATVGGKQGTIVVPGTWGAANWNTPAFDPETGIFYAASNTIPYINDLDAPADPKATMRVRDSRADDAGPADLEEMTSWSGGCGLAVDHQYLELRERPGRTG